MTNPDVFTLLSLSSSKAFSRLNESGGIFEEQPFRQTTAHDGHSSARLRPSRSAGGGGTGSKPLQLNAQGSSIRTRPESTYDQDLALVRHTIHVLLTRSHSEPLTVSYSRIQASCQSVVRNAHKAEGILNTLESQIGTCCRVLQRDLCADEAGFAWLKLFVEASEWYEKQTVLLATLLSSFDQLYLKEQKKPDMRKLAPEAFHKHVFDNATIVHRVQSCILGWATWERENAQEHASRPVIRALVTQLQHHGLYADLFESFYLRKTHELYLAKGAKERQELGAQAQMFLLQSQELFNRERARAQAVLPESSVNKVCLATETAFLKPQMDWVAMPALRHLMVGPDIGHLQGMYKLFTNVSGSAALAAAFRLYIKNLVHGIMTDGRADDQRIGALLTQRKIYLQVMKEAFYDHRPILPPIFPSHDDAREANETEQVPNRALSLAVIDGLREGLKATPDKLAELLAKHLHKALLRGPKGADEQDYFADLEAALSLHRFTNSKSVFRVYYHRTLAKRLLLGTSASLEHERFVLEKITEEYDPELSVGEKMLQDVVRSKELTLEFRDKRLGHPTFSVCVLERSLWPFALRETKAALPAWMAIELKKYIRFHKDKFDKRGGRKLKIEWDHALGYATLMAHFRSGPKELSVGLLQAIVLLLFNDADEVSFQDIASRTKIEQVELRRTLQSLACEKKRILKKHSPGSEINDHDLFSFNTGFTDPESRVHINPVPISEAVDEVMRAEENRHDGLQYVLRAAIARIMKAQKKLHQEQLEISALEAMAERGYDVDAQLFEECLEYLIDREFLVKRNSEDSGVLHYI